MYNRGANGQEKYVEFMINRLDFGLNSGLRCEEKPHSSSGWGFVSNPAVLSRGTPRSTPELRGCRRGPNSRRLRRVTYELTASTVLVPPNRSGPPESPKQVPPYPPPGFRDRRMNSALCTNLPETRWLGHRVGLYFTSVNNTRSLSSCY